MDWTEATAALDPEATEVIAGLVDCLRDYRDVATGG